LRRVLFFRGVRLLREPAPEPLVERPVEREREVDADREPDEPLGEFAEDREPDEPLGEFEEALPFMPEAAPRTAPRAALYTTSPAFIAPASPYTAPRRMMLRARGETAAAVAATATPISLSIKSSIATVTPGQVGKSLGLAYPWAG
jgi:hypothetical protein